MNKQEPMKDIRYEALFELKLIYLTVHTLVVVIVFFDILTIFKYLCYIFSNKILIFQNNMLAFIRKKFGI